MTQNNFDEIYNYIDSLFPNAKCELFYSKDYELVIAVMLSAQTTDKAVNTITHILFEKYPTLETINAANLKDIEKIVMPLGLYKIKASNIKNIAKILIEEFDSILPSDKLLLQKLPGIGNKSAGVIRAEIFKIPDLPVDTHILRITKRLGISKEDDQPIDVEQKLKKLLPENKWIQSHHKLIFFGRYFCTAKNPNCVNCKLKKYCNYRQ